MFKTEKISSYNYYIGNQVPYNTENKSPSSRNEWRGHQTLKLFLTESCHDYLKLKLIAKLPTNLKADSWDRLLFMTFSQNTLAV